MNSIREALKNLMLICPKCLNLVPANTGLLVCPTCFREGRTEKLEPLKKEKN